VPISDHIGVDTSGYAPVTVPPPSNAQLEQPLLPVRDSKLWFSAPNIPGAFPSSDTLIGYHLGGQIPQYRIPVPPSQTGGTVTTTNFGTAIISGGGTSTNTNTTTNLPAKAQTTSITTSILSPGGQFTGQLTMAKAFLVLQVTVNSAARIRLYGSASSQSTDLGRTILNGPGFGTEQSIIGDIVLDTTPVVWQAVNMTGYNADNPQNTAAYITVDNISQSSSTIQVSIVYVPIES
jgi:hypothetical protein